jgi:hypothetical protein
MKFEDDVMYLPDGFYQDVAGTLRLPKFKHLRDLLNSDEEDGAIKEFTLPDFGGNLPKIMKYEIGDKSRAICYQCKEVKATTLKMRKTCYSSGENVLCGVCDTCGTTVTTIGGQNVQRND